MENKRKFLRFNANVKANFGFWGALTPKINDCIIRDVSREGLRVTTKQDLSKNEKYELELQLPNDNTPVFFVGKTIWSKPVKGRAYDSGLEITSIKPQDRNKLLEYLSDQWIISKKTATSF